MLSQPTEAANFLEPSKYVIIGHALVHMGNGNVIYVVHRKHQL